MNKLALNVPQFGNIPDFPGLQTGPGRAIPDSTLGGILTGFFDIAFTLCAFLAFIWFVWGAFQYIFAGGDKEKLAKAKSRLTWAVAGLIIVALAFMISQFAAGILQPKTPPPIS